PLCSSFAIASDSVSMPEPTLTCKGLLHKLFYTPKQIKQGKDITICGDGKQTRDFIYAGDIAHGIAAALRTDHANRAYNLSTQQETSLNELVELLSLIAGRKIHPRYAKGRPGDIYHSLLANGRARRFLLWSPSVSLEEGLRRTYAAVK
ncbi:GDP-mannose 4,6-dehydratase, partial [uncultured Selenomonas sp.]|uniref:GDP-mannose 4,6-dehydratase n=1 Tax=uncultured Selenomonas sp. TaxID=159275 RepID=UPI0025EA5B89